MEQKLKSVGNYLYQMGYGPETLYEGKEELERLLCEGGEWQTAWLSSKKLVTSLCLVCKDRVLTLHVHSFMDEPEDLLYMLVDQEKNDPDEVYNKCVEAKVIYEEYSHELGSVSIPIPTTLDRVVEEFYKLHDKFSVRLALHVE